MKPLGKPLPPVEEIAPPSQQEQDAVIASWNANCPLFYVGLMEADSIDSKNSKARFLYDKLNLRYVHRKTGRVLTQHEVNRAFIVWTNKVSGK